MRNDLTDITVILDRSGSMDSCKNDAEGGLNTFIEDQKKHPGEATFTLIQFNDSPEFVHTAVPIKDVPKCLLRPRGYTALLDAVGRGINATGARLSAMPEDQRPGIVIFVILTDGEENASREFARQQIKDMIEHQTNAYKWVFMFLGANASAFAEAGKMGIDPAFAAQYSEWKTSGGIMLASNKISGARYGGMQGTWNPEDLAYTDSERAEIK